MGVRQSDPFSKGDWLLKAMETNAAQSYFNQSERASIFGAGQDVSDFMNAMTGSERATMGYADYTSRNPTSMQPKSHNLSGFLYNHQNDWYGKALLGALNVMSSQTVRNFANDMDRVANFMRPMNPIIRGAEALSGMDFYTGQPLSRIAATADTALDLFGGEIVTGIGRGLGFVLKPAMNSSLGTVVMTSAKLSFGSAIESAAAIFNQVDSALMQPIRGLAKRVGVFGGGGERFESAGLRPEILSNIEVSALGREAVSDKFNLFSKRTLTVNAYSKAALSTNKTLSQASTHLPLGELEVTHPRMMGKKAFNRLLQNIEENGINESIKYIEYEGKNYVVDGNHRLAAARSLGFNQIPAQRVEFPYLGYKTVDDLDFYDSVLSNK